MSTVVPLRPAFTYDPPMYGLPGEWTHETCDQFGTPRGDLPVVRDGDTLTCTACGVTAPAPRR